MNHSLRMCWSSQRAWSALAASIAAIVISGSAIAAEPVINGVVANLSAAAPYLTITGTNVGTTKPTVTLGAYPALSVTSFAATTVTATLPPAIAPGSYLLTLTKAGGKDEFWVTDRGGRSAGAERRSGASPRRLGLPGLDERADAATESGGV